jgi:hypothetical protein
MCGGKWLFILLELLPRVGVRSSGVLFMGRGGGVRELVDLLESYVEARVEKCVSGNYALLLGDWMCIVQLLVDSGVVREPSPLALALDPFKASDLLLKHNANPEDFVVVTPAPLLVAIRMDSHAYDNLVKILSRMLCCGEGGRFEFLIVGRDGYECYFELLMLRREPAWFTARGISKVIVEDMVGIAREMARWGVCRSEKECLESTLAHLKALRGCN